jgi:hypothetical protein
MRATITSRAPGGKELRWNVRSQFLVAYLCAAVASLN